MIYLLLILALLIPISAEAQLWPNAPTNGVIVSDHNFTTCQANGWTGNCGFIRSDVTAPHSPPSIMRWEYDTSTGFGGGEINLPLNVNEVWIGYWFKLSSVFQGTANNSNKFTFGFDGFSGNGYWTKAVGPQGSGAGVNGGPFFMQFHLQGTDASIDNCHVPGGFGECFNRAWNGGTQITLGVWHRVELYYKHSTSTPCSGSNCNGVSKLWYDGQLELDLSQLDTPSGLIQDLFFTPTWTSPPDRQTADQISFDHVRVVQCSGCTFGGADVTPPSPVTGITVE